jgi:hypothetical protein
MDNDDIDDMMDNDDIDDMFDALSDDSTGNNDPTKYEHFVNTKLDKFLSPNELILWTQWRDNLSYRQRWQDEAVNPATGSSFVVNTQ